MQCLHDSFTTLPACFQFDYYQPTPDSERPRRDIVCCLNTLVESVDGMTQRCSGQTCCEGAATRTRGSAAPLLLGILRPFVGVCCTANASPQGAHNISVLLQLPTHAFDNLFGHLDLVLSSVLKEHCPQATRHYCYDRRQGRNFAPSNTSIKQGLPSRRSEEKTSIRIDSGLSFLLMIRQQCSPPLPIPKPFAGHSSHHSEHKAGPFTIQLRLPTSKLKPLP